MSTNPTSRPDRETFWQRTLRSFLGERVRIKLKSGSYLEGELKDPQPYTVNLLQLSGTTRLIDYDTILSVEAAQ